MARLARFAAVWTVATSQQQGKAKEEDHLPISLAECTDAGCTGTPTSVTLDGNWRWTHTVGGYSNCYTGTQWDPTTCDTPEDCAKNCAVEGVPTADWTQTYGVTTDGSTVTLKYEQGNNIGSRMYMLDNETHYRMFKLLNREFTFDVDVSQLPCGLNGALYFSEMAADGGLSEFAGNSAGAQYGTGYCDAQCPHDIKFIDGEANTLDWNTTSAMGKYGSCCAEMDIWEANSRATAYTAHPCTVTGPKRCENDVDCGMDGFCDRPGCDLNTYRFGDKTFFGEGASFPIDTTKPFTIVTQFITSDGTDTGDLVDIRRVYYQDGNKVDSPALTIDGNTYSSITTDFCTAQKDETGDSDQFGIRGGLKQMGEALGRGMVLVMSLWDDGTANMLWLDSVYPPGATGPGAVRGPCATTTGVPSQTRSAYPNAYVTYGNIKVGTIGSTMNPVSPPTPAPPSPPSPTPPPVSPTPPPPSPPSPTPVATQCCYGSCTSGNCQGGWCGQSEAHCTGSCAGIWCPAESFVGVVV